MHSLKFWLVIFAALVAFGAVPTSAAADDAQTCMTQSGDDAIAACSRAIASNKFTDNDLAALYARRGNAQMEKGSFDQAITDFDEAIRLNPNDAHTFDHRGIAYYEKGDKDRAFADYDAAIRIDPQYAHAYANRGVAWMRKGNYDRAIADYDEAIRLDPNDALNYTNRGNAWGDKGDYSRAIADYDKAIRLNPNDARAFRYRGNTNLYMGAYDRAIADYDEAIRLDPNDVAAYANRGDAWSSKGNFDHAIVDYDAAVRLNPNDAHAYNHRGKAYFDKGDTDRAIADYDAAIRLNPRYAHAYENRGEAWNAKGDYARSIADYDAAMRLNTSNTACASEAGRVIECIKPSATDPAIHRFDNPRYVIFNDNSGPGANLLVFLPGTNGRPPGPVRFLKEAADAGYRVISLSVNDVPAVGVYCPRKPDPDCSERFRRMRVFGDATLDPAIDNTPAESIVNRLVKLLQYLDRKEPQRKWGDYLENGAPKWDRIALAGQSQGAGMAAFIAQREKVARVILFSSPWDFQVTSGHVRTLAPWISGPSKTPPERWYGGYHEREKTADLIAQAYAALRIPRDHIRVFQLDLPPAQQSTDSPNPFHGQGISNPAYDQDRAFFLGRSP